MKLKYFKILGKETVLENTDLCRILYDNSMNSYKPDSYNHYEWQLVEEDIPAFIGKKIKEFEYYKNYEFIRPINCKQRTPTKKAMEEKTKVYKLIKEVDYLIEIVDSIETAFPVQKIDLRNSSNKDLFISLLNQIGYADLRNEINLADIIKEAIKTVAIKRKEELLSRLPMKDEDYE